MSLLKCKMCGGTLKVQSGQSVAVCEYCGTMQTLPNPESERNAGLCCFAPYGPRNDKPDALRLSKILSLRASATIYSEHIWYFTRRMKSAEALCG